MVYQNCYNAKLLLTSEYLVLDGAEALAVPLRFGQCLTVKEDESESIRWKSVAHDNLVWFTARFEIDDFSIIESSARETAINLQKILRTAKGLGSGFCSDRIGYEVTANLNYPLLWGLGSSSTLIAAIADWAKVDPFKLHYQIANGSGYDIACAINNGPILYSAKDQQPNIKRVHFLPDFADKIFFVYQGRKQNSSNGISLYRNLKRKFGVEEINLASDLTDRMLNAKSLSDFENVILEHELLISSFLGLKPIKETIFYDLPGEVKSLGAWGGDFCMLTWNDNVDKLYPYLKTKGLEVCFNFNDIVL